MKFIAMLMCLALASCTTTSLDAGIQRSLPAICQGGDTAYAVLLPFIAAGKLKPKTEAAATAAHESLVALCADPGKANLATVLVAASTAALTISTAVREAKRTE